MTKIKLILLKSQYTSVLSFVMTTILFFILFSTNSLAFGSHFGSVTIYSDVYTGRGNSSNPVNEFDPVEKEIYSGETVKWSNPTAGAPYPHMVTFLSNQSNELKFKITNFTLTLQSSNSQTVIDNLNRLISQEDNSNRSFSSRSIFFPSVMNSTDFSVTFLNSSANPLYKGAEYNFTGNEPFLNSGIIWAGGIIPDKFPKINSFIVTFKNPGTYHYQCLIYPEMKGTLIVKPNPGVLGIHVN
jgi:plastocyanin